MLSNKNGRSRLESAVRRRLSRFGKDDRGAILVLSLFLLFGMTLLAGTAIDIVRAEQARVRLQGSLDRCVLMAASHDGSNVTDDERKDIVVECMGKAGLIDYLDTERLTVTSGGEVVAHAKAYIPTIFMDAVGVEWLLAPASVAATQNDKPVEIVLVLDVSGSMSNSAGGGKSRLEALKEAANAFVKAILENPENPFAIRTTYIAIVPYSWTVNMGTAITKYYGMIPGEQDTGCFAMLGRPNINDEFGIPANGLNYSQDGSQTTWPYEDGWHAHWVSPVMVPSHQWPRQPKSDSWYSSTSPRDGIDCIEQVAQGFTNNPDTLYDAINGLTAAGNTSMEIGMKWGMHMLDPSFRPVMNKIITNGEFSAASGTNSDMFYDRPYDYNTKAEKYVVLMSDGDPTTNFVIKDGYRFGPSNIYRGTQSGTTRFSVYDAKRKAEGKAAYYVPASDRWQTAPYGSPTPTKPLTWEWLWDNYTVEYVVDEILDKWVDAATSWSESTAYNELYGNVRYGSSEVRTSSIIQRVGPDTKETRLQMICDSRDKGVRNLKIYTIAFRDDANIKDPYDEWSSGEKALYKCATTPAFYFAAPSATEINGAFAKIAGDILKLRLTQ